MSVVAWIAGVRLQPNNPLGSDNRSVASYYRLRQARPVTTVPVLRTIPRLWLAQPETSEKFAKTSVSAQTGEPVGVSPRTPHLPAMSEA